MTGGQIEPVGEHPSEMQRRYREGFDSYSRINGQEEKCLGSSSSHQEFCQFLFTLLVLTWYSCRQFAPEIRTSWKLLSELGAPLFLY
ncbi:hypothetical protein GN956_G9759 [Arapaima gigas]